MNRTLPFALVVAVAVVAVVWAAVAGLPLLSESYTQLALVQRFASPADAFDPQLVPFRPLQHLTFHWFERFADGAPAVGRAFTFGLHALAACLVFAIVRRLGAPARGAWVAMLLFLAFPTAKGLTWVAAVSGPGRTACLLWIVWATIAYTQRPTRGLGVALVAVFAVALGFHQSSIVAPAIFGLGVVCLTEGNLRARLRAVVALARRPAIVVFALFAVGYFLYVGTLQNRSYHGIVQPGAIAANVARAALALAPEWVRLPALEGLRDAEAPLGFALGAAAVAGMLGLWALGLWRGRAEGRWLLLAIPLDLALPILTTGFVGRYAYFSAALLAIVLGLRFAHSGPGRAGLVQRLLIGVLAVAWAVDHVVDVRELRQAGAVAEQLLADATAARAAAPAGATIALVDAPDHVGREDDIPLFNWGLAEALARRGVPGPWLLLRVDACWTTSDHRALREEDLPAALAEPGLLVLRYDAGHRTFAAFRPR